MNHQHRLTGANRLFCDSKIEAYSVTYAVPCLPVDYAM
jgi:hypothetical protein